MTTGATTMTTATTTEATPGETREEETRGVNKEEMKISVDNGRVAMAGLLTIVTMVKGGGNDLILQL